MKYYSAKTVTQILGVTAQTLRNWDKEGKLKPAYTKSNGYRYYSEDDIMSYTKERDRKKEKKLIGYIKNSSLENEVSLTRKKESIETYLKSTNQEYEIIIDVGSSLDYNRAGLKTLIAKINKKEVDEIVICYKDNLVKYGFELIEYFAYLNNVKIKVLDINNKSSLIEIKEDFLTVVKDVSRKYQIKNNLKSRQLLNDIKRKIDTL
ncbi:MAG: IS607 family transposase [Bacilli bacterium]|nr:IS607 family transposase [Bacilli bacterium]